MAEERWQPVATANPYLPPQARPNAIRRGGWEGSGPTLLSQQLADYVNDLESQIAEAVTARERAEQVARYEADVATQALADLSASEARVAALEAENAQLRADALAKVKEVFEHYPKSRDGRST